MRVRFVLRERVRRAFGPSCAGFVCRTLDPARDVRSPTLCVAWRGGGGVPEDGVSPEEVCGVGVCAVRIGCESASPPAPSARAHTHARACAHMHTRPTAVHALLGAQPRAAHGASRASHVACCTVQMCVLHSVVRFAAARGAAKLRRAGGDALRRGAGRPGPCYVQSTHWVLGVPITCELVPEVLETVATSRGSA
jgi:hypothetical protein